MVITAARVGNSFTGRIGRLSGLVGVVLLVSACGSGGDDTSPPATPVVDSDRLVLEVQPIQVCDDGGIVCAQVELFETIADKIWNQANIEITFLPFNQLNDGTYLTIDNDEFADISFSGGAGSFGRHPDSSRTQGPINLWFVDVIETSAGLIQFGNAWIGLNGALISDDIFEFNNGVGRLDVIAHELGHNLGLRHSTLGAGTADNLMSSGSVRTIPETIDDIFPDGEGLSRLTSEQIERARLSSFVTAEAADEILPVAAADAIPDSRGVLPLGTGQAAGLQTLGTSQGAVAATAIPEGSPSPLTWMLLLPLGLTVRRLLNH
ncbi:MAG: hypothetical protein AAF808_12060 [Cyanobacteria bacterium P01_D01_bin.2]